MVTHQPAYNITDRADRQINGGPPLTITAGVRAAKSHCQVCEAHYHTVYLAFHILTEGGKRFIIAC